MPPLAAVPDLDRELDALYALPLGDFTKSRNDLVARLRKAHQTDAAETVRALKKPTLAAWAANQLARSHPDLVGGLVQAGGRLRDVQQRALAGKASQSELAEATARDRDAVRALVAAARKAFGERATSALLDRLTRTLRAAAVDPALATILVAGRLTEELQPVGFGPLEAVAPARRRASENERRAARRRVAELRAEVTRLTAAAREAAQAAARAEREAARLRDDADTRRRDADAAATALAEAEAELG